jgi:hypothetical protein
MNATTQILFALLRGAIRGTKLSDEEKGAFSRELLPALWDTAKKHDLDHLLAYGLKKNGLLTKEDADGEKSLFKAIYRYEQTRYEYTLLCKTLEAAQIPFLPLKGSVLRGYYPEGWMRTSCDIDVLVRKENLEEAISYLSKNLQYEEKERATHDVSLFSPRGIHVELHFDLVEEGRAMGAIAVLQKVWEDATPKKGAVWFHEMSDPFFYFYHVAHMAKHFETGGCGIRPFIDLWILDHLDHADKAARDALLEQGGLKKFAENARALSRVWMEGEAPDETLLWLQSYLLHGGVYGSSDNRVALNQTKKGGRFGYLISRVFIPFAMLKRWYPILEKHPWLMPVMQVRRWFMLLKPDVAAMAKRELATNSNLEKSKADQMKRFLDEIGLD